MAYADYPFYTEVWHGDMPKAEFAKWGARASLQIDRQTRHRAADAPAEMAQALALCCCELADELRREDAAAAATQGGAVAGEAVDGYSISYRESAGAAQAGVPPAAQRAAALCRIWLCEPVDLMYRGTGQ